MKPRAQTECKLFAMEEVEIARKRCKAVIERIERLPSSTNITNSCKQTLLRSAFSELNFLSRFSSSLPVTIPISVNIGHLEAVLFVLQHPFITGVSRVCKSIRNGQKSVHVDVVCTFDKSPVWILVSDRNPKYISWNACHKSKGLKFRVEQLLAAARSSGTLRPRKIVLFFSNGVREFIRDHLLNEFGAVEFNLFDFDSCEEVEDGWMYVLPRLFHKACALEISVDFSGNAASNSKCGVKDLISYATGSNLRVENANVNLGGTFGCLLSRVKFCSKGEPDHLLSENNLVNFDTTALIALVSGISNGCAESLLATPEIELRQRFKGNVQFVIAQATSELQNPIHEELVSVLAGKRGIICESVLAEFKELVLMCGGPHEKLRADCLLKCFVVVNDSPSERMMELPVTRKLALKNKVVFGTGDCWHAPTLTANMAFVRAVSQTGMSLSTIEHRPRALTGD